MKQQTGKTAAIYYRAANKQMLELHLDNQMHTLLCLSAGMTTLCDSLLKGGDSA